jgi:hypothetical protein
MWGESLLRFALGGLVVSAFAVLGEVLRPKSFAGILGAAPSVAVVALGLAVARHGPAYGVTEARSMAVGSAALAVYSAASAVLDRRHVRVWLLAALLWLLWGAVAAAGYAGLLR